MQVSEVLTLYFVVKRLMTIFLSFFSRVDIDSDGVFKVIIAFYDDILAVS